MKLGHESHLKRVRHIIRDNRKGFNNYVLACNAATDIQIISMFEHDDNDTLFDCVLDIMRSFFKKKKKLLNARTGDEEQDDDTIE